MAHTTVSAFRPRKEGILDISESNFSELGEGSYYYLFLAPCLKHKEVEREFNFPGLFSMRWHSLPSRKTTASQYAQREDTTIASKVPMHNCLMFTNHSILFMSGPNHKAWDRVLWFISKSLPSYGVLAMPHTPKDFVSQTNVLVLAFHCALLVRFVAVTWLPWSYSWHKQSCRLTFIQKSKVIPLDMGIHKDYLGNGNAKDFTALAKNTTALSYAFAHIDSYMSSKETAQRKEISID